MLAAARLLGPIAPSSHLHQAPIGQTPGPGAAHDAAFHRPRSPLPFRRAIRFGPPRTLPRPLKSPSRSEYARSNSSSSTRATAVASNARPVLAISDVASGKPAAAKSFADCVTFRPMPATAVGDRPDADSIRMPQIFLPPISTSLGHLMVGCKPVSRWTHSATPTAAQAVSTAGAPRRGRRRQAHREQDPGAGRALPRAAVLSATDGLLAGQDGRTGLIASAAAAVIVLDSRSKYRTAPADMSRRQGPFGGKGKRSFGNGIY